MIFILRRLLASIPVLLGVATTVFFVIRATPGDPAIAVLGEGASEAALEAVRERMGLNDPIYVQYWNFISGLVRGDLGVSLRTNRPISDEIMAALPHTISLTLAAIIIGLAIGVPLGVATAIRPNGMVDYVGRIMSLAGLSFPSFFIAIIFMYIFAVRLGWFPTFGVGPISDPLTNLRHLALPAFSLGAIAAAYVTRTTRSVVMNTLGDDYVRTAKSKGVSSSRLLFVHALRPASLPVVSLVGLFMVGLLGGSVMTEIVFSRIGLGRMMVEAALQRDYTMLQSAIVVFAFLVVVMNLLTDMLYGVLDPKIRASS